MGGGHVGCWGRLNIFFRALGRDVAVDDKTKQVGGGYSPYPPVVRFSSPWPGDNGAGGLLAAASLMICLLAGLGKALVFVLGESRTGRLRGNSRCLSRKEARAPIFRSGTGPRVDDLFEATLKINMDASTSGD